MEYEDFLNVLGHLLDACKTILDGVKKEKNPAVSLAMIGIADSLFLMKDEIVTIINEKFPRDVCPNCKKRWKFHDPRICTWESPLNNSNNPE